MTVLLLVGACTPGEVSDESQQQDEHEADDDGQSNKNPGRLC